MAGIENGIGLEIILWIQSWRTPLMESAALVFAFLGQEDFYLTILPLIYWCIDADFGRRLNIVLTAGIWSNGLLKEWWKRPRPYMVSDQVRNVAEETSYGLPSGHAQGTTVLWGTIAYQVKRRWVTIAVAIYIVLMAISRMVLGVHYPQDVLAGTLIGLVLIGGYAWLEPQVTDWLNRLGTWAQIGLVIGVTAVMLAIHPGLVRPTTTGGWESAITVAGVFLGSGIGYALEVHYVRFNARGVWWKRVLRFLLGVAGVMALRLGLKAAFTGLEPEPVFRLIRYALIGFWAAVGAPWLFVLTGLSARRGGSVRG